MILDDFKSFLEGDLPNRVVEAIRHVLAESPHLEAEVYSAVVHGIREAYTELSPATGHAPNDVVPESMVPGSDANRTTNSFLDRGNEQFGTIEGTAMEYPWPMLDLEAIFGYPPGSFEAPDHIEPRSFPSNEDG